MDDDGKDRERESRRRRESLSSPEVEGGTGTGQQPELFVNNNTQAVTDVLPSRLLSEAGT